MLWEPFLFLLWVCLSRISLPQIFGYQYSFRPVVVFLPGQVVWEKYSGQLQRLVLISPQPEVWLPLVGPDDAVLYPWVAVEHPAHVTVFRAVFRGNERAPPVVVLYFLQQALV